MPPDTTISVVIPLYNHEKFIDAALDSIMAQTIAPCEIIIVDDGSTDGSFQRVQARAQHDPRIIAWSHPNQGAHATINAGLKRASGTYIAILNSDDCYHPQRFETCMQAMAQMPGTAAVCSALTFLDAQGKPCRNTWYEEALTFYRHEQDLALALINGNFLMTTSNLFIRRAVFDEVGHFANLRYAHDLDFFLRLLLHGQKIKLLEQPLLHYRIHAANTISEGTLKVKQEWAAVVAFFAWQIGAAEDWQYLARLANITERHNLTRLLLFFFKYYQQQLPADRLKVDSWQDDEAFRRFLAGAVR